MSFDTLTIVGILAAIVVGGFLIALVSCNDGQCKSSNLLGNRRSAEGRSRS
jgi:hypothetical protein